MMISQSIWLVEFILRGSEFGEFGNVEGGLSPFLATNSLRTTLADISIAWYYQNYANNLEII